MTVTVDRSVEEFTAAPRKLFIDGQWTEAASGKTFETPNPATGQTLANVAEGDAEDINRAVSAARKAFDSGPWSRMTPSERGRLAGRRRRPDHPVELPAADGGVEARPGPDHGQLRGAQAGRADAADRAFPRSAHRRGEDPRRHCMLLSCLAGPTVGTCQWPKPGGLGESPSSWETYPGCRGVFSS
jgi:hypothetical protein